MERSSQATANASPPPAMVRRAPIFNWSRSGPKGITAVAKNKAKTSPIEAMHPTTTSSRQLHGDPLGHAGAHEEDAHGHAIGRQYGVTLEK